MIVSEDGFTLLTLHYVVCSVRHKDLFVHKNVVWTYAVQFLLHTTHIFTNVEPALDIMFWIRRLFLSTEI